MQKKVSYKIAEHVFDIVMDEKDSLWDRIGNLQPFQTNNTSTPVFTLEIVENIDVKPKKIISESFSDPKAIVKQYIYETSDGFLYDYSPNKFTETTMILLVSNDYKKASVKLFARAKGERDRVNALNYAIKELYGMNTWHLMTTSVHASTIIKDGKAVLFHAKSGTGKSTHASLWLKHVPQTQLLNDDQPFVRVWNNGEIFVYGSPWSGKTSCYRNIAVPIKAFVRIHRSSDNYIRPLSIVEAYASLLPTIELSRTNPPVVEGKNKIMTQIISTIPCYSIYCTMEKKAAIICASELGFI